MATAISRNAEVTAVTAVIGDVRAVGEANQTPLLPVSLPLTGPEQVAIPLIRMFTAIAAQPASDPAPGNPLLGGQAGLVDAAGLAQNLILGAQRFPANHIGTFRTSGKGRS